MALKYKVIAPFLKEVYPSTKLTAEMDESGDEIEIKDLANFYKIQNSLDVLASDLMKSLPNSTNAVSIISERMQALDNILKEKSLPVEIQKDLSSYQAVYVKALMISLTDSSPNQEVFDVKTLQQL